MQYLRPFLDCRSGTAISSSPLFPRLARIHPGLRRSSGMKLVINGEDRNLEGPLTLSKLVEQLGMKPDRVAVELNLDIVPREQWLGTQLAEGDRLEIVHFVGGGAPR